MINKLKKQRHEITLSIEQSKWLEKQLEITHLNKSKYIAWILSKKANEMYEYAYLQKNKLTEEEQEELIKIIKTPWIKHR